MPTPNMILQAVEAERDALEKECQQLRRALFAFILACREERAAFGKLTVPDRYHQLALRGRMTRKRDESLMLSTWTAEVHRKDRDKL